MQLITPQILNDLMKSLQRFFKIGIYYPTGHAIADEAAATVLHLLKIIVGKKATYLTFTITEDALTVQGIELDYSLAAVKHFHDLLYTLRIARLEIHRDITADEFRLFLSRLLFLRSKIQSQSDFEQIDITGLPSTVKVKQLKFLACQFNSDSSGSGDSSQPTIDYLLSSLVQQGLEEEQVSICRELLETIPEALAHRQIAESDLPSVTWDDVEQLLHNVAKSLHGPEEQDQEPHLPEQHHNVDALIAILKSIETTTGGRKSRDAVNLLVKIAKGTPPKALNNDTPPAQITHFNEHSSFTIQELSAAQEALGQQKLPADLSENNRSEELSILMQMLGQERHIYATLKMQEVLRTCLSGELDPGEWRIIVRAMRSLLTNLERQQLEGILLMFLEILRRATATTPLRFLYDVCQGLSKEEFMVCWPYLMNEVFIVGPKADPTLFKEICIINGILSRQDMHAKLAKLERLTAMGEQIIAPDVFSPLPFSLHSLFILLLSSSHAAYIYKQMVIGLKRHPLGWLDRVVAPLLDPTIPSHQQFIVELLREENPDKPSKDLKKQGATLIVELLPAIDLEQRNSPWVAEAIAALGSVRVDGAKELLNVILQEKHYVVLFDWPGPCRNAAHQAFAELYQYEKKQ